MKFIPNVVFRCRARGGFVTGEVTDRYGLCDGFNFLKYLINKDCDGVTAQNTGRRGDRQEEELLGIRRWNFQQEENREHREERLRLEKALDQKPLAHHQWPIEFSRIPIQRKSPSVLSVFLLLSFWGRRQTRIWLEKSSFSGTSQEFILDNVGCDTHSDQCLQGFGNFKKPLPGSCAEMGWLW
jgi:hypothetical protein